MKYPLLVSAIVASIISVSLAACGSSSSPPAPSPTFTALPYAAPDFASSYALAMSPDGRTISGASLVSQSETGPVIWVNGTIQVLPFMGPETTLSRAAFVTGISPSGVLVGNQGYGDLDPLAYYYKNSRWTLIQDEAIDSVAMTAPGISNDGNVIVGTASGSTSPVEKPVNGGFYFDISANRYVVISSTFTVDKDCTYDTDCLILFMGLTGDGKIAVGADVYAKDSLVVPIAYDLGGGAPPVRLALPFNYAHGEVRGVSNDGTTMVGLAYDPFKPAIAVYWDSNYQVHTIGSLGPDTHASPATAAKASSANGSRIVGTSNGSAFIWEAGGQIADLQDWLTAQGLGTQLKDWSLVSANAISTDGHWVAGTGIAPGNYATAFQVYLP